MTSKIVVAKMGGTIDLIRSTAVFQVASILFTGPCFRVGARWIALLAGTARVRQYQPLKLEASAANLLYSFKSNRFRNIRSGSVRNERIIWKCSTSRYVTSETPSSSKL